MENKHYKIIIPLLLFITLLSANFSSEISRLFMVSVTGADSYPVFFEFPGYSSPVDMGRVYDIICFDANASNPRCQNIDDNTGTSYTYPSGGTKRVTLKSKEGLITFYDFQITIPTLPMTISKEKEGGYEGEYRLVADSGQDIADWLWNFGGTSWESGSFEITHIFNNIGQYQIIARGYLAPTVTIGGSDPEALLEIKDFITITDLGGFEESLDDEDSEDNDSNRNSDDIFEIIDDEDKEVVVPTEPPILDITFDPGTVIVIGQEISFDASDAVDGNGDMENIEFSWNWNDWNEWLQGNGDTEWSTDATGSHTYTEPGIYYFILKIRDNGGLIDRRVIRVTVMNPIPNGGFFEVYPPTGTLDTVFIFTPLAWDQIGSGSGDILLKWDFDGDGEFDTSYNKREIIKIRYKKEGSYMPIMMIKSPTGIETKITGRVTERRLNYGRILVNKDPGDTIDANFHISPESGNIYTIFNLDGSSTLPPHYLISPESLNISPYAFRWDFDGDGNWDTDWSKSPSVRWQFREVGRHEVIMEVFRDGYSETVRRKVTVERADNPYARFTAKPQAGAGANRTWEFDATTSYDAQDGKNLLYRWDFESDGIWDTDWLEIQTASCYFPKAGEYISTLEIRDRDYFTSRVQKPITVYDNEAPEAKFTTDSLRNTVSHNFQFDISETTDKNTPRKELEIRWDWEGDNRFDSTWEKIGQDIYTHQYQTLGTKFPLLEVRDYEGVVSSYRATITIKQNEGPSIILEVQPQRGFFSTEFTAVTTAQDKESPPEKMDYGYVWDYQGTGTGWQITYKTGNNTDTHKYSSQTGWQTVYAEVLDEDKMSGSNTASIYIHPDSLYIDWLISNKATNYAGYDQFQPDAYITRAALLKFIYEIYAPGRLPYKPPENQNTTGSGQDVIKDPRIKIPFADIKYEDWYTPYIIAAFQDGVMYGFRDRRFRPEELVSVVGALNTIFKMYDIDIIPGGDIRAIKDVDKNKWYAPLASYALAKNVWSLDENDNFMPLRPLTRAEAARLIYLVEQIHKDKISISK